MFVRVLHSAGAELPHVVRQGLAGLAGRPILSGLVRFLLLLCHCDCRNL